MTNSTIKCEYLLDDKRCQAIQESEEGKSVRNRSCRNTPKDACCYLCNFKEICDVSCGLLDKENLSEQDRKVLETIPYDKGSPRNALFVLGFIIMVIGFFIAFAMPYNINSSYTWYNPIAERYETITSTVTVYGHPIGWVFGGIGFFMLLIGLMMKPNGSKVPTRMFYGKVCGNCWWFGKPECKRNEKLFNAMPCEDFTP